MTTDTHYILQSWMPSGGYASLYVPRTIDSQDFEMLKTLIEISMSAIRPSAHKKTFAERSENPVRYHAL